MKIIGFEFHTVSVPFIPRIEEYWGWDYPTTLIKVFTEEGITGLGESNSLYSNIDARAEELTANYVGKRIEDLNIASEPFDLQCAFYDIMGQALGVPVWKLIGTKYRDEVELVYWTPPMPPEEMARESEDAVKKGFRTHKVKGHRPWDIIPICKLIDEAVGDKLKIRMDPNTQWRDYANAVRIASKLEQYNIEVYEDPFQVGDPAQYREFRAKVTPPVARHLGSPRDVFVWLKNEAMDCFNTGGNVAHMRLMDGIAQGAGCPFWIQVFAFGSCVASTFAVHLAATLQNCTMGLDELPHIRLDDLSGGSFVMKNGAVVVPDGPGLGVTVDWDAVKHYEKPKGHIGTIRKQTMVRSIS
jgi:L-alanine-DL-glutamate epimerase-like enolase superfamily enzyme